ncbi:hypothetical protein [Streptomyces canus]|uniref:hypothetical protein n=1 Tax=Streptomyces canus TaxID=58343 RepID=UPI0037FB6043
MTTATHRRTGPHGSAVRWTWAAVVALLAALAVLVHHDTMSPATPNPALSATSTMPGMDHGSAAMTDMTEATASAGHDAAFQVTGMVMGDDGGACSGMAMQHCSAGDIGTAKFAPPPAVTHVDRDEATYGVPAGHGPRGEPDRAPPDLSVLSRLLI